MIGWDIEFHSDIPSTQDRARELVENAPVVVVADRQTAGRGRMDHAWQAPAGTSLLASWALRPAPTDPALFALLAAVAVARALAALGCPDATVKWPNDVRLGGRKVAGILANGTSGPSGSSLVIGIGINVSQRVLDLPAELRDRATSLALTGRTVDRLALLVAVTRELGALRADDALAEWRARSDILGQEVRLAFPGALPRLVRARDIAEDGALLVETPYGLERVLAGEVSLLG